MSHDRTVEEIKQISLVMDSFMSFVLTKDFFTTFAVNFSSASFLREIGKDLDGVSGSFEREREKINLT